MERKQYITLDKDFDPTIKITEELMSKVSLLPTKPGVYLFKNATEKIIYVGKAINLRSRVKSYFKDLRHKDPKTLVLIKKIIFLEYFIVDSEAEALILEDTLIKKHKPRYNVMLRDDKTYPYIKITNEVFPRVLITRKVYKDGGKYYGPYTDIRQMKFLLKTLGAIYKLRSCKLNLSVEKIQQKKFKYCLDFQMKRCDAPCISNISKDECKEKIGQVKQILSGRNSKVKKVLQKKMLLLSDKLKFEEAGIIKNQLQLLKDFSDRQKVVSTEGNDRDIFGLAVTEEFACSIIFKVREGRLIGKRHFIVKNMKNFTSAEILQRTVEAWYLENEFIPKEIFLSEDIVDIEYISDWLSKKSDITTHIYIPKIGDKRKIVTMANANAMYLLKDYQISISKREQSVPHSVQALKRDLRMKKIPIRIECFDNSHIQGSELVSSMVVFENGKAKKSEYRKYKMKTVHKNDDFAAMRETILRRYSRLKEEEKVENYPDLIIVDGGKGQLSSAVKILTDLELIDKMTIIGLAKRLEEVFFPNQSEPVILPKISSSLKLVQQIRDEAHRFAITFHRQLRDKRTLQTELTKIKGVGEKTAEKLLTKLGSVENIKHTDIDTLSNIVNYKTACMIIEYFEKN